MLFNTIEFAIFLPIVFFIYWLTFNNSLKLQNGFLLVASLVFYAWWDYRFLFLLMFTTVVTYYTGIKMNKVGNFRKRKFWFALSIIINIGFLGIFKYYNFFIDSVAEVLLSLGFTPHLPTLQILLPVGISFYTFHGLSYVIDIYNNKINPINDFVEYSVFVSFFPLLVAGPIERATHLLPQIQRPRTFEYNKARDGLRQILWGLFKKIVIADNAAIYANDIFNNYNDYGGSTLLIGAVFFSLQIYCDFSGYSDIALGTARLLGIELLRNFNFPYFSRDIAEFWRRWHISLTTWFRDYLYIPLGGSKAGMLVKIRNTFIIFIVSGFWHGANWTFIIWGLLNAIYFLPLLLLNRNRINTDTVAYGRTLPNFRELLQMATTFLLVTLAWVFFRADSISHAINYFSKMFSATLFTSPLNDIWAINTGYHIVYLSGMVLLLIIMEWAQRNKKYGLEFNDSQIARPLRWTIYYVLILCCFLMNGVQQDFIYFQF